MGSADRSWDRMLTTGQSVLQVLARIRSVTRSHTPQSDERADPRIARTRDAIAEAVRALLSEEGWDAITHQRVAERSGYARNTVYRHFADRAALLAHGGNFERHHHAPVTGDLRHDIVAELIAFRRELFDGVAGQVLGALLERAERDPEVIPIRDRLVAEGAGPLRELLLEAQQQQLLTDGVSIEDHTAAFCGPLIYARLISGHPPGDSTIHYYVDRLLDPELS